MALTFHPVSATHGSAALDNVLMFVSRATISAEMADVVRRHLIDLGRAFPAGLGCVYVIHHDRVSSMPDKETRRALLDLSRQAAAQTRAALVVLGSGGPRPALVRVMTATVAGLARAVPLMPVRIYPTVAEGAEWLCETLRAAGAPAPAADALVAAGEALVQRVRAEAPPRAP